VAAQDKLGLTPLHKVLGSYCGNVGFSSFLVEHGTDTKAQGKDATNPLRQVSSKHCLALMQFLVEHGANVTAKDNHRSTPLHQVSQPSDGDVELAQFLVEHGANTTVQDEDGSTPLHLASRSGNVDLAQFLIEHGANTTAQDRDWRTLLLLFLIFIFCSISFCFGLI
jgi:ankyrin repeat protein